MAKRSPSSVLKHEARLEPDIAGAYHVKMSRFLPNHYTRISPESIRRAVESYAR